MPNPLRQLLADRLDAHLDSELLERIDQLKAQLGGHETDAFGFDPDAIKPVMPFVEFLYRRWFRVQTHGIEHLPAGRFLLIANHSGQIPLDAMMLATALLLDAHPPRAVRSMVERWVPSLPFISTFFARLGQVLGTPENCRLLLANEHAVVVFPEGQPGINKTFDKRYQLQAFGNGFMRLALETRTPIVPVGIVGAEEQYPALWNLEKVGRLFGAPALPIAPTMLIPGLGLLPLPTRYRIWFGHPMAFSGDPDDDDTVVSSKVAQVKAAVEALIQRGLAERAHVFW